MRRQYSWCSVLPPMKFHNQLYQPIYNMWHIVSYMCNFTTLKENHCEVSSTALGRGRWPQLLPAALGRGTGGLPQPMFDSDGCDGSPQWSKGRLLQAETKKWQDLGGELALWLPAFASSLTVNHGNANPGLISPGSLWWFPQAIVIGY